MTDMLSLWVKATQRSMCYGCGCYTCKKAYGTDICIRRDNIYGPELPERELASFVEKVTKLIKQRKGTLPLRDFTMTEEEFIDIIEQAAGEQ